MLVCVSLLALPLAIGLSLADGADLSGGAEFGCAVVFCLMALRLVLRIREDGRVTEDLVRSEEDFRELIEASSDGLAIMDRNYRLLFTSPGGPASAAHRRPRPGGRPSWSWSPPRTGT